MNIKKEDLYTPEKLEQIKNLYLHANISLQKIAYQMNTTTHHIIKILKHQKITIKKNIKYQFDFNKSHDEIIEKYDNGLSLVELSKELDCSVATIRKFLKYKKINLNYQCGCTLIQGQRPFYFYLNYTDETFINKYKELYINKKFTIKEVITYFNCSLLALQKAITRFSLPTRNKSEGKIFKKTNEHEILELYQNEHFSAEKISEICDINVKTVLSILKRNNVFISGAIKKYKLPCGMCISIRGYEPQFLDYIFSNKLLIESDINYKPVPINYINIENKPAKYYPDFYISKYNLIVEIKSTWTFQQDKNVYLKEQTILKNGMKYIRIIDNDFSIIEKIIQGKT